MENQKIYEINGYNLEKPIEKNSYENTVGSFCYLRKGYKNGETKLFKVSIDESITDFYENEIKINQRLNHNNIVKIRDDGSVEKLSWIMMDYISFGEGNDLHQLIYESDREISLEDKIKIMSQISSALIHSHNENACHFDIKPNNVLIDETLNAYLTDYNMGRISGESDKSQNYDGIGRINERRNMPETNYISPEQQAYIKEKSQIRKDELLKKVDKKSDIYSTGLVFIELLLERHSKSNPCNFSDCKHIPSELGQLLTDMIDENYDTRLSSMEEFSKRLNDIYIPNQEEISIIQKYENQMKEMIENNKLFLVDEIKEFYKIKDRCYNELERIKQIPQLEHLFNKKRNQDLSTIGFYYEKKLIPREEINEDNKKKALKEAAYIIELTRLWGSTDCSTRDKK